nr:hypothetical protein GCM10010200_083770 [Actinomadura rugatobispora]
MVAEAELGRADLRRPPPSAADFTTVKVTTLRAAIVATQAIRHARDAGTEDEEHQVLTEDHLGPVRSSDHHNRVTCSAQGGGGR